MNMNFLTEKPRYCLWRGFYWFGDLWDLFYKNHKLVELKKN